VCVQCKVQGEIVNDVCTVNGAETVISVYSALCRVRLSLVCVQCTVQSETVTGVCTVHGAE